MKKLSLLLLAICVTLAGATAGNDANAVYEFNPYAYDLTSTWNENTGKLTVNFKLNSAPNLDADKGGRGIQIYAVDSKNNRYYILGPSEANIKASGKGKGPYSFEIDLSSGYDKNGKQIPFNEDLTWEVTVAGRPSTISGYNTPRYWNWSTSSDANFKFQKRFISQGIAINTNPQSPNFGRIYITDGIKVAKTDAYGNAHGDSFHSYAKGRGVYILEPDFFTFGNNGNPSTIGNTADRKNGFVDPLEPWCIRTTDDGRVFVSSYSKSSATAVWELTSNAPYYRNWNAVLNKSDIGNRRVIGMDVKGSGSQLTLLVLCQGSGKELKCYEINLGTSTQYNSSTHTLTEKQVPSNINFYEDGINGHAQVAYGNGGAIWYSFGIEAAASKLYRVKADGTTTSYSYGSNYGGEGFIIKNNLLIKGFRTGSSSNSGIYIYGINNDNLDATASYIVPETNTIGTGYWITDFALDYANNLYAASSYYGRVMPISLPYSGTRTTRAQTKFNFRLKAVPNILATDLRYEVNNANEYIFSFNTNTQPEFAELRFYKSYESMKQSLNRVNADDFAGDMNVGHDDENLVCYYPITKGLKQGKISVTLGGVGGTIENKVITNDRLPAGELYWSVYVQTRKSKVFAPIYKQGTTGEDAHYRLHATVNNYPETDGFGHIYAAQYDTRSGSAKKSLMVYNFNANGNSNDNQGNISNSARYKLLNEYVNHTGSKPKFENQRRLAVAPDGKVYISDHGLTDRTQYSTQAWADRPMLFTNGGIWVWDPKSQTEDYVQISMFLNDKTESSSGLAIYDHGNQVKLYGMNTYGEFADHTGGYKWNGLEYTEANQDNTSVYGWNGFKEYNLGTKENILYQETAGTMQRSLGMGDGNGNISIVAMDKGVWMAQHRMNDVQFTIDAFKADNSKKPALPDNTENYVLSFVPYGSNTRTWRSCTTRGIDYNGSTFTQTTASELTQLTTSPLQSCPGAGLAYRKTTTGKESLYIVNHQGDIVELQITSWSGTTPSVKYIKTWPGSGAKGQNDGKRTQGFITTMNFDYAGNLITTSGAGYTDNSQDIIVYTMPYDRTNAREIQAPNSCRMIPERMAQTEDNATINTTITANTQQCALDFFRPLQSGMYNTICLPFDLNVNNLPDGHPYKGATIMEFNGVTIANPDGEEVLELNFTSTNGQITAGTPYLIQPEYDVPGVVSFDVVTFRQGVTAESVSKSDVTFAGVLGKQALEEGQLLVVANNRLAESTGGTMLGFRAYFILSDVVRNMQPALSFKRPVATAVGNASAEGIDVEKFIREGRIYIRLDDQVYDLTGARVQ